jgi:hypothetical protein
MLAVGLALSALRSRLTADGVRAPLPDGTSPRPAPARKEFS